MNLRDFEYICAVAEHNHFGKAAQICNVSQPTLSSQIKKMETFLGVQIFERTKRRTFLTPVGKIIIGLASQALLAEKEIKSLAKLHKDPLSGELNIGIIPTIGSSLISLLLPVLMQEYSKLEPVFVEATTEHVIRQLNEGKIEIIIIASRIEDKNYHEINLYQENFKIALPAKHALCKKKEISIQDLNKDELLLLCDGHCLREQVLEVCDLPDSWLPGVKSATRATSIETLINLVIAGYGFTLIPALTAKSSWSMDHRIRLYDLKNQQAKRQVRMIYRKASYRKQAIQKIAETIQKMIGKIEF